MFKNSKLEFHTLIERLVIYLTWELLRLFRPMLRSFQSSTEPALQLPPHQKQCLATLYEITMIYLPKSG